MVTEVWQPVRAQRRPLELTEGTLMYRGVGPGGSCQEVLRSVGMGLLSAATHTVLGQLLKTRKVREPEELGLGLRMGVGSALVRHCVGGFVWRARWANLR